MDFLVGKRSVIGKKGKKDSSKFSIWEIVHLVKRFLSNSPVKDWKNWFWKSWIEREWTKCLGTLQRSPEISSNTEIWQQIFKNTWSKWIALDFCLFNLSVLISFDLFRTFFSTISLSHILFWGPRLGLGMFEGFQFFVSQNALVPVFAVRYNI